MAILSEYSKQNDLLIPPTYVNNLLLAANVPEFFTVPTDQNGKLANYVQLRRSTVAAADIYVSCFTAAEGADRVTNGTFATDTAWTKGTGWTIAAGVATATGAISTALSQNAASTTPIIQGQSYLVTYTATRSAGTVTVNVGGTAGTARSTSATFAEVLIAASTQDISFTTSGFTGTVDDVTVLPCAAVTADNSLGTASEVNPPGYFLNGNISVISVVGTATPTVTAAFYR